MLLNPAVQPLPLEASIPASVAISTLCVLWALAVFNSQRFRCCSSPVVPELAHDAPAVIKTSYKRECQDKIFSAGSVPTLFCLGIQPNCLNVHINP